MSKSIKKTAVFKDRNPYAKKSANKKVRRFLNKFEFIPKGNIFKKIFNQYNICDYKFYPDSAESISKAKRK